MVVKHHQFVTRQRLLPIGNDQPNSRTIAQFSRIKMLVETISQTPGKAKSPWQL